MNVSGAFKNALTHAVTLLIARGARAAGRPQKGHTNKGIVLFSGTQNLAPDYVSFR